MTWTCQRCGGEGRVGKPTCRKCDPTVRSCDDSNRYRDEAGVIVTARDIETGELWSLHQGGLAIEAVRRVCRKLEAAGPQWRVVSVCTPRMILRDLNGMRYGSGGSRGHGPTSVDDPRLGEITLLGKAGYGHLLEGQADPVRVTEVYWSIVVAVFLIFGIYLGIADRSARDLATIAEGLAVSALLLAIVVGGWLLVFVAFLLVYEAIW